MALLHFTVLKPNSEHIHEVHIVAIQGVSIGIPGAWRASLWPNIQTMHRATCIFYTYHVRNRYRPTVYLQATHQQAQLSVCVGRWPACAWGHWQWWSLPPATHEPSAVWHPGIIISTTTGLPSSNTAHVIHGNSLSIQENCCSLQMLYWLLTSSLRADTTSSMCLRSSWENPYSPPRTCSAAM